MRLARMERLVRGGRAAVVRILWRVERTEREFEKVTLQFCGAVLRMW